MKIVIQKFGGTSVASPEARKECVKHVKRELSNGNALVVVVSAMGRKGDPYATDTLLTLLESELGNKEKDLLLNTGELISAAVFSSLLNSEGVASTVLTGGQAGIITNNSFGSALIMDVLPERIINELQQGKVVVVPGFQGVTTTGEVTTLGRGGSDTTAAALGAGLKASVIDIFTDVKGLMTADPRMVKDAQYLKQISYEDVAQMAWGGATVIHPRAVELAMKHEIPMRIRSTFSEDKGTVVTKKGALHQEYDAKETMIAGVVSNNNIDRFVIHIDSKKEENQKTKVFNFLKQSGISIDFINVMPDTLFFTVNKSDSLKLINYLKVEGVHFTLDEMVAKISVVGHAINGEPGVMTDIINALEDRGIQILQSCDSNTTIWILVNKKDEINAVCSLHKSFFTTNQMNGRI